MCIAILNKQGTVLTKSTFMNSWHNNPDGGGLLYALKGRLHTFKSMKKGIMYKEYERIRKAHPDIDIILHFRIGTHGANDETNLHPFLVNDKLGFVHNGIISQTAAKLGKDDKRSDTNLFNEELKRLPDNFVDNEGIMNLIKGYIGTGSKLIFMDNLGNYRIVNEMAGHWNSENWFSNDTYSYDWNDRLLEYEGLFKEKKGKYKKYKGYSIEDKQCRGCMAYLLTNESKDGICIDCHRYYFEDELTAALIREEQRTDKRLQGINYRQFND